MKDGKDVFLYPCQDAQTQYDKVFELIRLVFSMLTASKWPEPTDIGADIRDHPDFEKLCAQIMDIRTLAASLNQGDLQKFVYGRGYILSNLKALQSNLRHLTWQTQKIAEGDFTQRVDFLGEFSESFNSMTVKLKESSQQLHRLATYDALTQIPNRMSLDIYLAEEFKSAKETGRDLSILLFDIDHFKRINDSYGHDAGDRVLVRIAEVLSEQFRATDMFARYGGEEFVAVLPGMNCDGAYKIALRALEAVAKTTICIGEDTIITMTVSAGISEFRQEDESYDAIMKRSDHAMYKAKQNGGNRACIELVGKQAAHF